MSSIQLCNRCNAEILTPDIPSSSVSLGQLRSMRLPTPKEDADFRNNFESFQDRLRQYDAEILSLEGVLAELKGKRSDLQRHVDAQCGMLASIRRLPLDVISHIFDFECEGYGLTVSATQKDKATARTLALSHVCAFWREIALSRPSLWSRISIPGWRWKCQRLGARNGIEVRKLLKLYLDRSQNLPLTLNIESTDYANVYCGGLDWSLFSILFRQRSRWFSVSLDLECLRHAKLARYLGEHEFSFPTLEYLNLQWKKTAPPTDFSGNEWILGLSGKTPRLHKLVLKNSWQEFLRRLDINYDQITSLRLLSDDLEPWRSGEGTTGQFQSLEHFATVISSASDDFDPSPMPINKSTTLKSLSFVIESLDLASELLPSLVYPSLTSLDIALHEYGERSDEGVWVESLSAMIQNSPNLHSFRFSTGSILTGSQILDIFSSMPSLTNLTLDSDSDDINNDFFRALTLPSLPLANTTVRNDESKSSPSLLPRLTSLTFSLTELYSRQKPLPDPDIIVDMILSRRPIDMTDPNPLYTGGANFTSTSMLQHFGLFARARACSASEQTWAVRLRALVAEKLRLRDKPWTCQLDLGEL
ncbi:hypothetical protein VKT23_008507 [Stygiomarasmius scandens]|uniref:F-box domain-containing protein n=1 Tax=Marasmiellus scandens TaxID=2682957 RepID=A0ABR1JJF7_9AGAR